MSEDQRSLGSDLTADGAPIGVRMEESERLYDQAKEALESGQLEQAVDFLQRSNAAWPHAKTLEVLGECFMKTGRLRESIVHLGAATGLSRGSRAPRLLAEVMYSLGLHVDAALFAREALRRCSTDKKAKSIFDRAISKGQGDWELSE